MFEAMLKNHIFGVANGCVKIVGAMFFLHRLFGATNSNDLTYIILVNRKKC